MGIRVKLGNGKLRGILTARHWEGMRMSESISGHLYRLQAASWSCNGRRDRHQAAVYGRSKVASGSMTVPASWV